MEMKITKWEKLFNDRNVQEIIICNDQEHKNMWTLSQLEEEFRSNNANAEFEIGDYEEQKCGVHYE